MSPLIVHILSVKHADVTADAEGHRQHFKTCMEFLKRLGDTYWHAEFYHELLSLTTGYALNNPQLPGKPDPNNQSQNDIVRRPYQEALVTAGADQAHILLEDEADKANFEDDSMAVYADEILEGWLEGGANWLDEYTNFQSIFSSA